MVWTLLCAAVLVAQAAPVFACSDTTDCDLSTGTYRALVLPEATGTLVFAHGYKGSAAQVMMGPLRRFAETAGVNLIALQSAGDDWAIPNAPTDGNFIPRDETAYVSEVFEDLAERFDLDATEAVLAGFSAGVCLCRISLATPDSKRAPMWPSREPNGHRSRTGASALQYPSCTFTAPMTKPYP